MLPPACIDMSVCSFSMSSPTDVRRDSIQPRDLIICLTKEPLHYAMSSSNYMPLQGLKWPSMLVLPWVSDVSHFRGWRWSCSWLFFWKCLDLGQNSSKMGPFRLILGGITHVFPRFFVKNEYLRDFMYFCLKSAVFGIFWPIFDVFGIKWCNFPWF